MPTDLLDSLGPWWSSQLQWHTQPMLWVVLSLAVGISGRGATWLLTSSKTGDRIAGFGLTGAGQTVAWLLRLVWLVAPGYAALLCGAVSPRLLGLSVLGQASGLAYGSGFAALAFGLLVAAGLVYRRAAAARAPWVSQSAAITESTRIAIEAGARQWHWAFYRAALITALIAAGLNPEQATYWGVWVNVALVCLEGALNPFLWQDLRTPDQGGPRLLRTALLLATSVLYLITPTFWLAWGLHAATATILEPRLRIQEQMPIAGSKRGYRQT